MMPTPDLPAFQDVLQVLFPGQRSRQRVTLVFGTLIGTFIIAAIKNGMHLPGLESYTQKVALGLVLHQHSFEMRPWLRSGQATVAPGSRI